jgi:hypothetical protein
LSLCLCLGDNVGDCKGSIGEPVLISLSDLSTSVRSIHIVYLFVIFPEYLALMEASNLDFFLESRNFLFYGIDRSLRARKKWIKNQFTLYLILVVKPLPSG